MKSFMSIILTSRHSQSIDKRQAFHSRFRSYSTSVAAWVVTITKNIIIFRHKCMQRKIPHTIHHSHKKINPIPLLFLVYTAGSES